ncbi:MAG: peptidylprolyl isomerase [Psychrilyobacter sp.]|uniref:peptidylprolyl isomerase n=1 Tax=Psychrilyobacter sp. TaxID=2586924 RepID=UPI003C75CCA6
MKKMAIILIIASLALTACNKKEGGVKTKDESNVIMVIGNENLTETELQEKIATLPAQYKEYSKSEKGRAALIEEITVRKILKQEAIKTGIENTESYKKDLESVKEDLLINHVVNKKIVESVKLTDTELEAEYEKNKENFKRPEQIKAAHILINVSEGMTKVQIKAAKKRAEKILKEVTPANFNEMAKKYSEGPTSENGGELGWFDKTSMVKEFADAAFTGVPEKIYGTVVKTQFGYHIIYVEDKKEAGYLSFEEVRQSLEKELLNKKRAEEYRVWVEDLKKDYIKK